MQKRSTGILLILTNILQSSISALAKDFEAAQALVNKFQLARETSERDQHHLSPKSTNVVFRLPRDM